MNRQSSGTIGLGGENRIPYIYPTQRRKNADTKTWQQQLTGTTKVSRVDENIGSLEVNLSSGEILDIGAAASKIKVTGDRYPEALEKRTGL